MFLVFVSGREIADEVPSRAVRLVKLFFTDEFQHLIVNMPIALFQKNRRVPSLVLLGNEQLNEHITNHVPKEAILNINDIVDRVSPVDILKSVYPYYRKLSKKHLMDYKNIADVLSLSVNNTFLVVSSYSGRTKFAVNVAKAHALPHLRLDLPNTDKKINQLERYLTHIKTKISRVPF